MKKIIYLPNIFKPYNVGDLIRLGDKKDGGYILSKESLSKTNFLISLGIAYNWDFEIDFLEHKKNKNLSIISYDNSISREIVKKFSLRSFFLFFIKPSFKKLQHIYKFFSYIKTFDGKKAIHISKNVTLTNSEKTINLDKIFSLIKRDENIILKIDIEGDEYYLLNDILRNLNRINVLIIEFHLILKNKEKLFNFIDKISNTFYISHTHINNVSLSNNNRAEIIEFTFEKKLLFNRKIVLSTKNYPIKNLDYPSSKKVEDCKVVFQ